MNVDTCIIDVSKWQGTIDWERVKPNINAAIIRCGYSYDGADEQFIRNVTECERLNIPYGVYLYSYATSDYEARQEAAYAISLIRKYNPKLPIFFDSEQRGTAKVAGSCAKAFIEVIHNAGYTAGVYASRSWWNNNLKGVECDCRWIASWGTNSGKQEPAFKPSNADIWQYTSNGHIDGINGRVDMNRCYVTFAQKGFEKTTSELAYEVLDGKWGNGEERKQRLTLEGYDYQTVQDMVNEILDSRKLKVGSIIKIKQGAKQYLSTKKFADFVYQRQYKVKQITLNRVVFTTLDGKTVMGAVKNSDCIVQ